MFVTIFVFYVVKSLVSGVFVQIYVCVYVFVIKIEENLKDSSLENGKSKYKEIFDFNYQNGLEYLVYPVTTTSPHQVFCDFSIKSGQTGEEVFIEKKGEPNLLKNVNKPKPSTHEKFPTPQVNCGGYFNIEQPAVMSKGITTSKTIIWHIPSAMQNHHKTKKPQMYEYEDATIFGQAEAVCNINMDFNKTRKSDFVVSDEKIKTSKRFQDQICSSVLRRRQNVKPAKTMDVHPTSSRERYQNQLHTTPYYTENIINFQHKSTKMSGNNLFKHHMYKTPEVKHFDNHGDTDPANTTTGKVVEIQYTCSSKASKTKCAMRATRSNLKAAVSFLKSRQKVVKSPDLSASKYLNAFIKSSPKKQPAVKPVESESRHKTARLHKPSVIVLHNIVKIDPFKLSKREPKKSIKARHGRIKNKLVPSKEEEFDLNLTPATSRQTTNFINVAVNNRTNKVFIAPSPIINQNAHPTAKISVHSTEESSLSLFSYYSSSKVVGFNNTWSEKFETYTNTTSDSCGKIIDSSTSYLSEVTNKRTNTKENRLIKLAKRIVKKLKFLDMNTSVTDSGIKIVTDKTGQRQLIVDLGDMEKSDQLNRNKLDKPLLDLDKPDLVQPTQLTVGMLWAGHEVYKNMHLEDIKSDSLPQTESIKSISVASSQLNYENQTSRGNTWAACKNSKNVYLKDVKQSSVSLLYTKNTKPMEITWAASKNSKNMYFEDVKSESLQTFNDKNQTVREGFWARMKNRKKLKIQHIKPISINEPDQKILRNETKTRECKSKKCKKPTHFLYQSALRPIFSSDTLLKM